MAEKILFAKTRNLCYDSSHSPDQGVARRWGREAMRDRVLETFCTQLETRVDFFYFFARNPLKSPDSDEQIQINPSYFAWIYLDLFGRSSRPG
jgi:hypothetical protein